MPGVVNKTFKKMHKKHHLPPVEDILHHYSWFFLVLIIIVILLFFFDLLKPEYLMPEFTDLGPDFKAEAVIVNKWNVYMLLTNNLDKHARDFTINIKECNNGSGSISKPVSIPRKSTRALFIPCNKTPENYKKFSSKVNINYNMFKDGELGTFSVRGKFRAKVTDQCICNKDEICIYGACQKGIIAYWPFDLDFQDHSLKGHNGITYNDPVLRKGKLSNGVGFNGVDSYIDSNLKINTKKDYTLVSWIKIDEDKSSEYRYYQAFFGSNQGNKFHVGIVGSEEFDLGFGNRQEYNIKLFDVLEGKWFHLAYAGDGMTASIYVNGFKVGSFDYKGIGSQDYTNLIGAMRGSLEDPTPRNFFKGMIDEAIVYDHALSKQEIIELYEATK